MQCVDVIFIDFGGVQEEVLVLVKLVLVMCDVIECLEVVEVGVVMLVGIMFLCIVEGVNVVLVQLLQLICFDFDVSFYGDGCVSVCIVVVLCGIFFFEFLFGFCSGGVVYYFFYEVML